MSQTFNLGGLGDNKLTKLIFSNGTANTCSISLDSLGYLVFEQGANTVTFPLGDLPSNVRLAINKEGRVERGVIPENRIIQNNNDDVSDDDSIIVSDITEDTLINAVVNALGVENLFSAKSEPQAGDGTYPGFANAMYFNGSSNYLSRTITAAGNQKTWTYSGWVKLSKKTGMSYLLSNSGSDHNNGISSIYFQDGEVHTYYDTTGSNPYGAVGPGQFGDTSAWYHVTWTVDAANSNHKVWINNRLISTDTGKYPPNYNYDMSKSGQSMVIGSQAWGVNDYFCGYMTNIQFIDGQALEPTDFGQYLQVDGEETNIWIPKPLDSSISYGANGFYLDFSRNRLNGSGEIDMIHDVAPIEDTGHTQPNDWTAN